MHFIVCQGGNFGRRRLVRGGDEPPTEDLGRATEGGGEVAAVDRLEQRPKIAREGAAEAPDLQQPVATSAEGARRRFLPMPRAAYDKATRLRDSALEQPERLRDSDGIAQPLSY